MSGEKFTPGPWVAHECTGRCFFEITPESSPSDSGLNSIGDVCASMHGSDNGVHVHSGEQEANAHLIAAAPDMYEILQTILQDDGTRLCPGRIRQACQVLARARGETS